MRRAGTRYAQPCLPYVSTSDTGVLAAELAEGFASNARALVLLAIARRGALGLTDEEGAEATHLSPNTYRPRRIELNRAGYLVMQGERLTRAGRPAAVWVFPDPDREVGDE